MYETYETYVTYGAYETYPNLDLGQRFSNPFQSCFKSLCPSREADAEVCRRVEKAPGGDGDAVAGEETLHERFCVVCAGEAREDDGGRRQDRDLELRMERQEAFGAVEVAGEQRARAIGQRAHARESEGSREVAVQ